jgi:hypothetical protein
MGFNPHFLYMTFHLGLGELDWLVPLLVPGRLHTGAKEEKRKEANAIVLLYR